VTIYSNLDTPNLTDKDREKREKRERNNEVIDSAYKKAEHNEQMGTEAPPIIFEQFQRDDFFTYDDELESDPQRIMRLSALPVKQYRVRADGVLVKEMGPAALECVKLGYFCFRCEQRQPDSEIEKRQAWERKSDLDIYVPGASTAPDNNCCFCSAVLGLDGNESEIEASTPEQEQLIRQLKGEA
jgi:hypothetical protein